MAETPLTVQDVVQPDLPQKMKEKEKPKLTGGKVGYYDIEIPRRLLKVDNEEFVIVDVDTLARVLDCRFADGTVLKSTVRAVNTTYKGRAKPTGQSLAESAMYDWEKVVWYAQQQLAEFQLKVKLEQENNHGT